MNKKTFQITYITTFLAALIITILSNFKFASYDKYFIFPITVLLITHLYLTNKHKLVINKKGYYQDQNNRSQNQQGDGQQDQPQMSEQNMQRMLDAVNRKEQETQEKLGRAKSASQSRTLNKNW